MSEPGPADVWAMRDHAFPVGGAPRLVICRDGYAASALTAHELEGVHRAMRFYAATGLVPRLLATIEALSGRGDAGTDAGEVGSPARRPRASAPRSGSGPWRAARGSSESR